jgi:hypothetical protein
MSRTKEEYDRDELESEEGREAELQKVYEAGIEDAKKSPLLVVNKVTERWDIEIFFKMCKPV